MRSNLVSLSRAPQADSFSARMSPAAAKAASKRLAPNFVERRLDA
jgi:hypothetical protein